MDDKRSLGDSPYRSHQMELAQASLRIDEDALRRAGIHSYLIEIKTCSSGNWNVVYKRKADLNP